MSPPTLLGGNPTTAPIGVTPTSPVTVETVELVASTPSTEKPAASPRKFAGLTVTAELGALIAVHDRCTAMTR